MSHALFLLEEKKIVILRLTLFNQTKQLVDVMKLFLKRD